MLNVRLVIVLGACLLACEGKPKPAAVAPTDSAPALGPSPAKSDFISDRIAIFMEATAAQIDSVRAQYSEEDFAIVADDMMWYRASAYEYLEKLGIPVRRVEGRRVFEYMVNGEPKRFDFPEATYLDVIVLYEPNREPRAIAPVDLYFINDYYNIPRPDSAQ